MDGSTIGYGSGPRAMKLKKPLLLASTDQLALDATAAKNHWFNPKENSHSSFDIEHIFVLTTIKSLFFFISIAVQIQKHKSHQKFSSDANAFL